MPGHCLVLAQSRDEHCDPSDTIALLRTAQTCHLGAVSRTLWGQNLVSGQLCGDGQISPDSDEFGSGQLRANSGPSRPRLLHSKQNRTMSGLNHRQRQLATHLADVRPTSVDAAFVETGPNSAQFASQFVELVPMFP